MAKSRKEWHEARVHEARAARRIWPMWARSLGAMIEAETIVRFACNACCRLYDVDLEAPAMLRGRERSLIARRARCKASRCRRHGMFVAATGPLVPFIALGPRDLPRWLVGARPVDHEPDGDGGGTPPCSQGVDPVRRAYADTGERKRLVQRLGGRPRRSIG